MKKSFLFILVLLTVTIFCSCGDEYQQQSGQEQQETAPKEEKNSDKLELIQTNVDAMFAMFSGVPVAKLEIEQKSEEGSQGGETGGGEEQQDSNTTKGEEQQSSETGGGGKQQSSTQKQKPSLIEPALPVDWSKAKLDVQKIHIQWSEYGLQATKDGVSKTAIEKFGNNLNKLTKQIIFKNQDEALNYANELYYNLIDFWTAYDSKSPIDARKMNYHIRKVIILSYKLKWEEAYKEYNLAKDFINSLSTQVNKDDREKIESLEMCLYELDKVIVSKDYMLAKLKGKLVIDILNEIKSKSENE